MHSEFRRVLIAGGGGQLGTELERTAPPGWELRAMDLPDLDVTSAEAIESAAASFRPELVINAAAYTAVDDAERERDLAYAVNNAGVRNLAAAAVRHSFRLIHISTDFVFDGSSSTPYTPNDEPRPLSVYGASKLAGERSILAASKANAVIVRTAWLYSSSGKNFVKTIVRLLRERERLGVIADQKGSPTWARSLANVVWGFAGDSDAAGIFHWTDGGEASWYEFAREIHDIALGRGLIPQARRIDAIGSADYPAAAKRPCYSVLDSSATVARLGCPQRPWRDNLKSMMEELPKEIA